jgi:hypothetical protein
MGAIFGNFGLRRLMDQNMRFMRGGLTAWLRIKNFQDSEAFADMGFQYVPSITGAAVPTGTSDILIDPPPSVRLISMHTIAMAQAAGASLLAGARIVTISHTWVEAQMLQDWFTTMCSENSLDPTIPEYVFRGPSVLGIVTDRLLLQQVDVTHEEIYGVPHTWFVKCNASELSTSTPGS